MNKCLALAFASLIFTASIFAGEPHSDDLRDISQDSQDSQDSIIESQSTELAIHQFAAEIFKESAQNDSKMTKQKLLLVLSNKDFLRAYLGALSNQFETLSPQEADLCLRNLRMALAWWNQREYNWDEAKSAMLSMTLMDVLHRYWIQHAKPVQMQGPLINRELVTPLKANQYITQENKDANAVVVATMASLSRTVGQTLLMSLMNAADDVDQRSIHYATTELDTYQERQKRKNYPLHDEYRKQVAQAEERIGTWQLPSGVNTLLCGPFRQITLLMDRRFTEIGSHRTFEEQKAFTDRIREELKGRTDLRGTLNLALDLRVHFEETKRKLTEKLR